MEIESLTQQLEKLKSERKEILDEELAKKKAAAKALNDEKLKAQRAEREAIAAAKRVKELEESTTPEDAKLCVRSTSGLGGLKFYQIFSDLTGRFYFTNSGEKTRVKASSLIVTTTFARENGLEPLFKGQPYRHPKDDSKP